MKVLAIDPGEHVGWVELDYAPPAPEACLVDWGTEAPPDLAQTARWLFHQLRSTPIQVVVVEDYRVYGHMADQHIGVRLWTAEMLGCIEAVCALFVPQVKVVRLAANEKGKWNEARLTGLFPQHADVERPHAHDALQLGLTYLEKQQGWDPLVLL